MWKLDRNASSVDGNVVRRSKRYRYLPAVVRVLAGVVLANDNAKRRKGI
jgi:hypothetical protein